MAERQGGGIIGGLRDRIGGNPFSGEQLSLVKRFLDPRGELMPQPSDYRDLRAWKIAQELYPQIQARENALFLFDHFVSTVEEWFPHFPTERNKRAGLGLASLALSAVACTPAIAQTAVNPTPQTELTYPPASPTATLEPAPTSTPTPKATPTSLPSPTREATPPLQPFVMDKNLHILFQNRGGGIGNGFVLGAEAWGYNSASEFAKAVGDNPWSALQYAAAHVEDVRNLEKTTQPTISRVPPGLAPDDPNQFSIFSMQLDRPHIVREGLTLPKGASLHFVGMYKNMIVGVISEKDEAGKTGMRFEMFTIEELIDFNSKLGKSAGIHTVYGGYGAPFIFSIYNPDGTLADVTVLGSMTRPLFSDIPSQVKPVPTDTPPPTDPPPTRKPTDLSPTDQPPTKEPEPTPTRIATASPSYSADQVFVQNSRRAFYRSLNLSKNDVDDLIKRDGITELEKDGTVKILRDDKESPVLFIVAKGDHALSIEHVNSIVSAWDFILTNNPEFVQLLKKGRVYAIDAGSICAQNCDFGENDNRTSSNDSDRGVIVINPFNLPTPPFGAAVRTIIVEGVQIVDAQQWAYNKTTKRYETHRPNNYDKNPEWDSAIYLKKWADTLPDSPQKQEILDWANAFIQFLTNHEVPQYGLIQQNLGTQIALLEKSAARKKSPAKVRKINTKIARLQGLRLPFT